MSNLYALQFCSGCWVEDTGIAIYMYIGKKEVPLNHKSPKLSFYPRPVMAFGYCHRLNLSLCVSVNHKLVGAISPHPFKLKSPNLDQKMQNILLKVPIVLGAG